jgi:hypothetical protein
LDSFSLLDQFGNFSHIDMKVVFSYIKIVLLAVVLPAFSVNAQTTSPSHTVHKRHITESYALDTVLRLPEIKEANAYMMRGRAKDRRHLFSMIYGDPDSLHPYYWVVVGEDNGMCFVTHCTFYVYTNGGKILYHDNFSDSTMDLSTWRRKYLRKS